MKTILTIYVIALILTSNSFCQQPDSSDALKKYAKEQKQLYDKFNLTVQIRKQIYKEVILAEKRADKESRQKYPFNLAEAVKVGGTFQLTEPTNLMHEINPSDPLTAMKKIRKLPTGTSFKVISSKEKSLGNTWYYVKTKYGSGWINGIALISQGEPDDWQEYTEKLNSYFEKLKAEYEQRIIEKYNVNSKALDFIWIEGSDDHWPEQ